MDTRTIVLHWSLSLAMAVHSASDLPVQSLMSSSQRLLGRPLRHPDLHSQLLMHSTFNFQVPRNIGISHIKLKIIKSAAWIWYLYADIMILLPVEVNWLTKVTCKMAVKTVCLLCSYLEIYNEHVRDLLRDQTQPQLNLRVREHPKEGPYVQGAVCDRCHCFCLSVSICFQPQCTSLKVSQWSDSLNWIICNMSDVTLNRPELLLSSSVCTSLLNPEVPTECLQCKEWHCSENQPISHPILKNFFPSPFHLHILAYQRHPDLHSRLLMHSTMRCTSKLKYRVMCKYVTGKGDLT